MTTTQRKTTATPDLHALLELLKRDIFITLNCHTIATIQSFDPANQTVQATVNYKKTFYAGDLGESPKYVDYPVLIDCPIIVLSGGASSLTFPITAGDTCLMLFNDRDIDNWVSSGQIGPVPSQRMHSLSDGVALIGLKSIQALQSPTLPYDTTRAVLANGTTLVGVGPSLIKIANQVTTLKTVLNGMIDLISSITTTPAVVGQPLTLAPSVLSQLTSFKTTIGSLLE